VKWLHWLYRIIPNKYYVKLCNAKIAYFPDIRKTWTVVCDLDWSFGLNYDVLSIANSKDN